MRFVFFIIYFFIEIYLISLFIDEFGFFYMVLEIIISALLGFGILVTQGDAMFSSYEKLFKNEMKVEYLFTKNLFRLISGSVFRLICGILLIVPGILSDVFGVICFIISLLFTASTRLKNNDSEQHSESNYSYFRYEFRDSKNYKDEDIIDVEIIEDNKKLEK